MLKITIKTWIGMKVVHFGWWLENFKCVWKIGRKINFWAQDNLLP